MVLSVIQAPLYMFTQEKTSAAFEQSLVGPALHFSTKSPHSTLASVHDCALIRDGLKNNPTPAIANIKNTLKNIILTLIK